MGKDLNRSIKITLDNSDMTSKMSDMSAKSDQLRTRLNALNEAGQGNSREAQGLQKQYDKLTQDMEKYNAKVSETERVLNNLSGATYKELLAVKKQLISELKEEARGTEAYAAKAEQLARVQEELKNITADMTGSTQAFTDQLAATPGPLGAFTGGIKSATTAAKAFIMNPIGAVIAAVAATIALCVKGFKDFAAASEEGGLKAGKALAPVKVIGTEIGKLFKWVGSMVADVMGGITKGIYSALGFLGKFSDKAKEIHDNMTRQYEIEEKTYKLNKLRQDMVEREAQVQMELADLKLKMRQTDKYSAEERNQFLDDYLRKENELMKIKVDMAQKELELWELESEQDDNDPEANMQGARLKAQIYQQQTEYSNQLAQQDRRRISILKELNGELESGASAVDEAKKKELAIVDDYIREEKNLITEKYAAGEVSQSLYNRRLEELELESLQRKLEIYDLDLEARKKIEDQILEYRKKMFEKGENVKLPLPDTKSDENYYKKLESMRKGDFASLSKNIAQTKAKQDEALAHQMQLSEQYKNIATSASSSFGNIIGEFVGNTERSSEAFQYDMIMLALDTLQQMMLVWYAEIIGSQTAKLGPIFGPIAAAAGMGIIQGVFNGVKSSIKKPSTSGSGTATSTNEVGNKVIVVDEGYSTGGWTGSGDWREPAGIVHKEEYVIPAWQMKLPETIDMVNILEAQRQRGSSSAESYEGYAQGGYTGDTDNAGNDLLNKIYTLLEYLLNNPIQAYVVLSDFEKQQIRADRAKKIAKK